MLDRSVNDTCVCIFHAISEFLRDSDQSMRCTVMHYIVLICSFFSGVADSQEKRLIVATWSECNFAEIDYNVSTLILSDTEV